MEKFRATTNAFCIGNKSPVLTIPKEIAEEFEISEDKKTFFNVYTEYVKGKKRIIYEFTNHAEKK